MSKQTVIVVCLLCLLIRSIVWIVTDPRDLKGRLDDFLESKNLRVYLPVAIFLAVYLLVSIFLSWPASAKDDAWASVGLIIHIMGVLLAIWAKWSMKRYWGVPAQHDKKRQTVLVTDGPFMYTRNPIYLGILLMFIGFSLALRSYSIILCPVVMYVIYRTILIEEKLLHKQFGKRYDAYKAMVPRLI